LRGIRFTAPYGRNGRFESLREFTRNVIVNEFNGSEPDPIILDGMLAYMLEFDFLTNTNLNKNGTLKASAPASALRGERIFNRPFASMNGQSCASCHIPSANFLDHKRHDIGSVSGCEDDSRDRALDTPTLLSARWSQPYFHDGSQPTLRAVNEWFNRTFQLGLSNAELDDLTAYVETISDGVDAYEEPGIAVAGEMQEQLFFLASFEMLRDKAKKDVATLMFRSIADEVRNEATAAKDPYESGPIFEQLAVLMDEAYDQMRAGNWQAAHDKVKTYRQLYAKNVAVLQ
ncbi:MAG: hypothetical protein L0Z50_12835, partial [Verrucomicrobiales bacterium]|nr:hypothetical protein [Verrucomicrobiales bacterium]